METPAEKPVEPPPSAASGVLEKRGRRPSLDEKLKLQASQRGSAKNVPEAKKVQELSTMGSEVGTTVSPAVPPLPLGPGVGSSFHLPGVSAAAPSTSTAPDEPSTASAKAVAETQVVEERKSVSASLKNMLGMQGN